LLDETQVQENCNPNDGGEQACHIIISLLATSLTKNVPMKVLFHNLLESKFVIID
jgi:hypothetical protein